MVPRNTYSTLLCSKPSTDDAMPCPRTRRDGHALKERNVENSKEKQNESNMKKRISCTLILRRAIKSLAGHSRSGVCVPSCVAGFYVLHLEGQTRCTRIVYLSVGLLRHPIVDDFLRGTMLIRTNNGLKKRGIPRYLHTVIGSAYG